MPDARITMEKLLAEVRTSSAADFYRKLWEPRTALSELPTISREDFLRVSLSKRRYKNERALVKVVHDPRGAFLSEWSFADIGRESFGLLSKRPLVYLTDPHEAIEKSMWCYERGMVPLIGEKDPDITMFAADKYMVDSLVTDAVALARLKPYFESHGRLTSISVLGSAFDTAALAPYTAFADTFRLVLALPETGAFAEAPYAHDPRFKALPECVIERAETLVVSKLRALVTPIIKYRTHIPAAVYDRA